MPTLYDAPLPHDAELPYDGEDPEPPPPDFPTFTVETSLTTDPLDTPEWESTTYDLTIT